MAAKSADVRPAITMACLECEDRSYVTTKSRRSNPNPLGAGTFCPGCTSRRARRAAR